MPLEPGSDRALVALPVAGAKRRPGLVHDRHPAAPLKHDRGRTQLAAHRHRLEVHPLVGEEPCRGLARVARHKADEQCGGAQRLRHSRDVDALAAGCHRHVVEPKYLAGPQLVDG